MAARLLLEHLDAPGIALGDIGADGDRGRMEAGHRLHIVIATLRVVAAIMVVMLSVPLAHRRAAAEHRFAGAPRRQAVDLRAHDAFEEIRRARRQFERTKQEAFRLQHDLDPAAPEQRREIGRGQRCRRRTRSAPERCPPCPPPRPRSRRRRPRSAGPRAATPRARARQ